MRDALLQCNVAATANVGLAFDRYARYEQGTPPTNEYEKEARQTFFQELQKRPLPEAYSIAFAAYAGIFDGSASALPGGKSLRATTASPLAVGLGTPSVFEIGSLFMRPYGVPYIPGSSIKGAMRRVLATALGVRDEFVDMEYQPAWTLGKVLKHIAEDNRAKATQLLDALGHPEAAAAVTVYDAWMVPPPMGAPFLMLDTITVHHPAYYQAPVHDPDPRPPSDMDDPTPVSFLSVRPNIEYLFPYQAEDDDWARLVEQILAQVLTRVGLGGKTNAGYGVFDSVRARFIVEPSEPNRGDQFRARFMRYAGTDAQITIGDDHQPRLCEGVPRGLARKDGLTVRQKGRIYTFVKLGWD